VQDVFILEKSELEQEGNNCFPEKFYISCLKEREVFQELQVKLLGDCASFFRNKCFIPFF